MSNVTRTPTKPDAGNVEVTEHMNVDKIQKGNSDIPEPEWVPTEVVPGSTPLPIYPQPCEANTNRRMGSGEWITGAAMSARSLARDAGLALSGFCALVLIIASLSVFADAVGAL